MTRPEDEIEDAATDDTSDEESRLEEVKRKLDDEPAPVEQAASEKEAPDTDVARGSQGETSEPPA